MTSRIFVCSALCCIAQLRPEFCNTIFLTHIEYNWDNPISATVVTVISSLLRAPARLRVRLDDGRGKLTISNARAMAAALNLWFPLLIRRHASPFIRQVVISPSSLLHIYETRADMWNWDALMIYSVSRPKRTRVLYALKVDSVFAVFLISS